VGRNDPPAECQRPKPTIVARPKSLDHVFVKGIELVALLDRSHQDTAPSDQDRRIGIRM
jgi:hypothetical protein